MALRHARFCLVCAFLFVCDEKEHNGIWFADTDFPTMVDWYFDNYL